MHDTYLALLRQDSTDLLAAARAAGPSAAVPSCPGWTVDDLVCHIGVVHNFWGAIVDHQMTDLRAYEEPVRPESFDHTVQFAQISATRLADALQRTDPRTKVWTWASQNDVAFVLRRVAHETAVHRVDAERAGGVDGRVDADLASDGIDEFLEHFLPRVVDDAPPLDGSVHLHCTDVAGEWVVRADDNGYVVTREHAKGDAAVRGPAHDLLMVLWRRAPLATVEVIGDRAVAERLVARTNLG